jgi:probable addiction module antidote protein
MKRPYRSHAEATAEMFRSDPAFAAEYLDAVLADGDQAELMIALRHMADAFGGVARIAEKAHLSPTTLYRTLSRSGNPELRSLSAILSVMGLRIAVQPVTEPVA